MGDSKKFVPKQAEQPQQKKLSYEELTQVANELHQQTQMYAQRMQQMQNQMQELARGERIQVLGFAFKVLEHSDKFHEAFVNQMIELVQEALQPVETKPEPAAEPAKQE